LATCGGRCSLSGVMQRTAKHAAKIEPLIALGLHPAAPPVAGGCPSSPTADVIVTTAARPPGLG
jgi:hypothetical protein